MAWYDIGTVSVTNGSTTVTGSGTNFIAGAQIGEAFYGPDERLYEIQAIVSATVLTLGSPYLGATQTGQDYYIIPTQSLVATLANEVSSLITDFQSVADLAGAGKFANGTAALPGITFNLDQDTGFSRPAANQIGFSTAGVQRALLSSTALTLNVPISGTTGSFSGDATIHGATVGRGGGAILTNTAVGSGALSSNTTGGANTANGLRALQNNTTGNDNTANGVQALLNNTTGINNIATGRDALRDNTTGASNTVIGVGAGSALTTGNDNTIIGRIAGTAGLANTVIIGAGTTERMRITSTGNVGIGTSSPSEALTVQGNILSNSSVRASGLISIGDATAPHFSFSSDTDTGMFRATTDNLGFSTSGVERIRIAASGNVGIGTSSPAEKLSVTGNVTISGSLSKGSGSFKIDHPIKPDTHHLVHSFIEGPQADNLYRGKVSLVKGAATVNLDEAGRMTEGTFVALNGNVQCFTANEVGWTQVRGKVEGNILTIEAQDTACTDEVSWLVIGERHDQHMIDTNWTDAQGRIITEPEKVIDIELENDND